jgi:hypothetical protein
MHTRSVRLERRPGKKRWQAPELSPLISFLAQNADTRRAPRAATWMAESNHRGRACLRWATCFERRSRQYFSRPLSPRALLEVLSSGLVRLLHRPHGRRTYSPVFVAGVVTRRLNRIQSRFLFHDRRLPWTKVRAEDRSGRNARQASSSRQRVQVHKGFILPAIRAECARSAKQKTSMSLSFRRNEAVVRPIPCPTPHENSSIMR